MKKRKVNQIFDSFYKEENQFGLVKLKGDIINVYSNDPSDIRVESATVEGLAESLSILIVTKTIGRMIHFEPGIYRFELKVKKEETNGPIPSNESNRKETEEKENG